jgi:hypothetical protein
MNLIYFYLLYRVFVNNFMLKNELRVRLNETQTIKEKKLQLKDKVIGF